MIDKLIKPKEITVVDDEGLERTYIISKLDCVTGREIVTQYPLSAVPKLGDYKTNEEIMLKMMCFVGVPREGSEPLMLTTKALVKNHIDTWETCAKIELAMMEHNCSFFRDGRISSFFADLAQNLPQWISKILTGSLEQLSQTTKPPSTN